MQDNILLQKWRLKAPLNESIESFISVNTLIYSETPTGFGKTLSVTLNRYKEKTVAPDSEQITIIGSDDLKGFESIAVAQIELNRLRKPKTRKKPYLSTFSLINKTFNKWSEWRDLNPRPLGPEPSTLPSALHPDNAWILYTIIIIKSSVFLKNFDFF